MAKRNPPNQVVKTQINTIVLRSLEDGEKYGYEIIKYVSEKSQGTIDLKQPTLYSSLKRLENMQLISSFWQDSDIGGKRHYYELTEKGRDELNKIKTDWSIGKRIINSFIADDEPYKQQFECNITDELKKSDKQEQQPAKQQTSQADFIYAIDLQSAANSSEPAHEKCIDGIIAHAATSAVRIHADDVIPGEEQIIFFDDTKQLFKKTQNFRQAMNELKIEKQREQANETALTAEEDVVMTAAEGFLENTAESLPQSKSVAPDTAKARNGSPLCDDGIFIEPSADVLEPNWNTADSKLQAQKQKETKNDAVFITEYRDDFTLLTNENSATELNKSYSNFADAQKYESDCNASSKSADNLQVNYITSPLSFSQAARNNSGSSLINAGTGSAAQTAQYGEHASSRKYNISFFKNQRSTSVPTRFINAAKINLISATLIFAVVLIEFIILSQPKILTSYKTPFSKAFLIYYAVFGGIFVLCALIKFILNPNQKKSKNNPWSFLWGFLEALAAFALLIAAINLLKPAEFFIANFTMTTIIIIFVCTNILLHMLIKNFLALFNIFSA